MASLTKLCHKNIISLTEIIDDPSSKKVYLIMQFCSDGTLKDKLGVSEDNLTEQRVKAYFRSLISALHYCHEVQNIAHRDIKPENIMYDRKRDDILLCDFGCSEFFHPTSDALSNTTKGTYLFMAPEMFSADKSTKVIGGRQADIWAAGVTLFNLLTKKYPF